MIGSSHRGRGRRRKRKDTNRDFHTVKTTAGTADEVVALRFVEKNEILSTAPVPYGAVESAVVVTGFVHLNHIVLRLLVPKCYS